LADDFLKALGSVQEAPEDVKPLFDGVAALPYGRYCRGA
jgi:hypothetical protein